jgi:riboflavin biosynthesis pyrimidine reductase
MGWVSVHAVAIFSGLFAAFCAAVGIVVRQRVAQTRFEPEARPDVVIAGEDSVDMATAITALSSRGMRRVLCEGGPTLLDELVLRDLIDEMCVTIAPRLAGTGQSATSAVLPQLPAPTELSLHHVLTHQGYLFLKYGRADRPSSALM